MINSAAGNTFGRNFRVTTFGESHGVALGAIIDGAPSGIKIDEDFLIKKMKERQPNTIAGGTQRHEEDKVEILSGVFNGLTTGCPIALLIKNRDQHSSDYDELRDTYRPGHADLTYQEKFGIRDYRGGGRASGRETAARVAAGAIAEMILNSIAPNIKIYAYTLKAAGVSCKKIDLSVIDKNPFRAADLDVVSLMEERIKELRLKGDSCGGVVGCIVKGMSAGLGDPVFDKTEALLSHAIMSIGAVKGIEFGSGFAAADLTGSLNNDALETDGNKVIGVTNNAGGTLGGITTGDDLVFRCAIKPTPSIYLKEKTVKKIEGGFTNTDLVIKGRHDTCLAPRIAPVVEAMTAITLCDLSLSGGASEPYRVVKQVD